MMMLLRGGRNATIHP